jgi:hypothetical protein
MNAKQLERSAREAHRLNIYWPQFWQMRGEAIRAAEPFDRQRFRRLVSRLLALVVSGDDDGMEPLGDTPWEIDDAPQAALSDIEMQARCLFSLEVTP